MAAKKKTPTRSNFRKFFLRGLVILLPTVVTIGLLLWAYNLVQVNIAEPINQGMRWLVLNTTPWPEPAPEKAILTDPLTPADREIWLKTLGEEDEKKWKAAGYTAQWLRHDSRETRLNNWWSTYAIGMNLIGLFVAIILIYVAGAFLGSLIGRRLYHRGEELLARVPLIRQVYPSVKQVTEFLFGGDKAQKIRFSNVVAVQYPRKGLWSVGLVTGDTMRTIQDHAGQDCITVFVPSSPTPFTGYVITVPKTDTIDLPVSVEQALRFTVSGGVIIPPAETIESSATGRLPETAESDTVAVGSGRPDDTRHTE
jgi:uncharacterized membrane protein